MVEVVLRLQMGDAGWGAGAGLELVVLARCLVACLRPPDEGDFRWCVVGAVAVNTRNMSNMTFLKNSYNLISAYKSTFARNQFQYFRTHTLS